MNRRDIRVAVLIIEGTNCEEESVTYFRSLGVQAERVHLKQLTGDTPPELRRRLSDFEVLMVPGGFAAGDYVRAGAILAARMKSRVGRDVVDFVESGRPVFGVCNGFQVLVEMGLLPALGGTMAEVPEAVLAVNDSGHYECRPSLLRQDTDAACAFTRLTPRGSVSTIISSHAEGKLLFPRDRERAILRELEENGQVPFRYVDPEGRLGGYPWCPSGSTENIAALCNRDGNVFGIQPHPERCFFGFLHPDWTRRGSAEADGDGRAVFESVVDYVEHKF